MRISSSLPAAVASSELPMSRAPKLGPRPTSGARCGNLEDQCSPFPLTSASKQGAANDQGQRPLFELGSEGSENSLSAVACFAFVVSALVNAGAMLAILVTLLLIPG